MSKICYEVINMEKVIDFLKEIIIDILMGLLVGIIACAIGFIDSDCILPIIIGVIGGTIINRCYKRVKKSGN